MFLKTPLFPRLPFLRKAAAVFQNAGKVLFEWKPKRLAVQRSFLQRIDHRVTPVWLLPPIWQRWEITNFKPFFCIQYHLILRFINVIGHGKDIYLDTIFLIGPKVQWLKGKLGDFFLFVQSFYWPKTKTSFNRQFSPKRPKLVRNQVKGSKIHKIRTKWHPSYCGNPSILSSDLAVKIKRSLQGSPVENKMLRSWMFFALPPKHGFPQ